MTTRVFWLFLFVAGLRAIAVSETPAVSVTDAWSRPATDTGVVYATLHNKAQAPDRLVGAACPLARSVGLYRTSEVKMPGMSPAMGNLPMAGSMTSMTAVPFIPVPAGGTVTLAPGGYHLMLDLRRDLAAGETIPLRLHFARAGWISASARVKAME